MRFIEKRPTRAQAYARNIPQSTLLVAVAAILAVVFLSPGPLFAEHILGEILIESGRLEPGDLVTEPGHRVSFVNRSGQMVHVQFLMQDPEQHHLVQVPDRIWAIFHHTGPHPYVVHFPDPKVPALHGTVEIVGEPGAHGRPDPPVCRGVTVQGACIER